MATLILDLEAFYLIFEAVISLPTNFITTISNNSQFWLENLKKLSNVCITSSNQLTHLKQELGTTQAQLKALEQDHVTTHTQLDAFENTNMLLYDYCPQFEASCNIAKNQYNSLQQSFRAQKIYKKQFRLAQSSLITALSCLLSRSHPDLNKFQGDKNKFDFFIIQFCFKLLVNSDHFVWQG